MTARTFIYSLLSSIGIHDVGTRVFAKKTMTSSREVCPYIVYKLGYNAPEGLSEEDELVLDPERQFVQVWVHDFSDGEVADYMRIDEVIREVKGVFRNASSPEDGVMSIRYIETSQDLDDDTLNTVMRYIRFQVIKQGELT